MNKVFKNTRAVLFLATPHAGASLASLASAFRGIFGATVTLPDLEAHDANLEDLYEWYCDHTPDAGIETACYYETRAVKVFTIVTSTSARAGVGANPVPVDEDHLSIAKPRGKEADVYGTAVRMLRDYVLAERRAEAARAAAVGVPAAGPAVVVNLDTALVERLAAALK